MLSGDMSANSVPNDADVYTPVLQIQNLQTYFHTDAGIVRAVNGVTLSVSEGEACDRRRVRVWQVGYWTNCDALARPHTWSS
jgi:hypothetical protein